MEEIQRRARGSAAPSFDDVEHQRWARRHLVEPPDPSCPPLPPRYCPGCGSGAITAPVNGCRSPWHGHYAGSKWVDPWPDKSAGKRHGGVDWGTFWAGAAFGIIALGLTAALLAAWLILGQP
jgi:hypothetical protein